MSAAHSVFMTVYSKTAASVIVLNIALLLFVFHDALSKELATRYPVFEVIFLRSLFALPLVTMMLRIETGRFELRTGRPGMLILRGLLSVAAFSFFLVGLKLMPLADTFALFMSAPLLVTVLCGRMLGEPATRAQWVAVLIGFGAVLFMIRPGGVIPFPGALVMLASVSCFSFSIIITRSLGRTETASMMTAFVMLTFVVVTGVLSPLDWVTPTLPDLGLMLLLGALAATAMYGSIYAYRNGPPALMAPFQYVSLVWAAMVGFLVFGDVPDLSVVIGGVIIVASGIFVLRSERA